MICRGCDFILDTGFLGDGILDEEQSLRPGAGGVDPGAFNLADAVILGNIDDDSQSFETSDSGFHMQQHMQARLYVSGRSQALMSPDAVPALAGIDAGDGVRLTPFEKHVLAFIDGKRPVEVIRRAAGLDEAEVKTALATLADKGVVKVVGRALADFDPGTETAPRRAPQRHRMRGSMVGAVALVGDEADRAIEEAFRTQVALSPLGPASRAAGVADGDVFDARPAKRGVRDTGPREVTGALSDLPSDVDQFVGLKGTDEIEKKRLAGEHTSSTLRPSAQKAAVNRAPSGKIPPRPPPDDSQEGIDASAEASAVERSIVDKSDGFDDFGQPSDVSTAVVAQQFSDSSNPGPPTGARERPRSGVFADISDLDGGVPIESVQSLADSRLVVRPKLTGVGPRPSPHMASSHSGAHPRNDEPVPIGSSEIDDSLSVEIERRAASGEVWDNSSGSSPRPPTSQGERRTAASASLSDLLSDNDEEATANLPPDHAKRLIAAGQHRRAQDDEDSSFEEPTAAGQPPPPLPLPRVGPRAAQAAPVAEATSSSRVGRPRQSAMVSMPDEDGVQEALDETSGLHDVDHGRPPAAAGDRPQRRATGAVDEIFDEGSDGFLAPTGPEVPKARGRPRLSSGSEDVSSSMPSAMVQSIEVRSVHDSSLETAPPSQEPPSSSEAPRRDPSEISAPDDSEDDGSVEMVDSGLVIRPAARANPLQRRASAPRRAMASSEASTSDSARPLPPVADPARPLPPVADPARPLPPVADPRKSPPPPPGPPRMASRVNASKRDDPNATYARSLEGSIELDPPSSSSEVPFESSEETVNIDRDEQQRRGLDAARGDGPLIAGGRAGGVAAIPSGFSQVAVAPEQTQSRPRVTDENRRKARKLFDEAVKEAESGRLGAARMNAKLASIYDPDTPRYKEQLLAWENPAAPARPPTMQTAQAMSSSSRPSDDSQIEIKALYDEAQRYEDDGDIDEALDVLEQGVSRFPMAAAFHNRIGVILALRKRDYEGAVQAIQRAIDIDPENLHYKSNLGKIVAKMRGARADA